MTKTRTGIRRTATARQTIKANEIFNSAFSYGDLEFYRFKSSKKINIAKMSRCMGLSENFIRLKLAQKGLI